MAGYFTVSEDFGNGSVTDITTGDYFPFNNWWRNDPLSSKSYIRANVAGFYPYKSTTMKSPSNPPEKWKFAYVDVCSTIYPQNPQYKEKKEIILYR